MTHTSSPIARQRIAGCVFILAFVGVSIYFGIRAWNWNSDFHEWIDAKPMQMTVDLRTPSTHSAPFTQTCVVAHSQSIYVAYENPDANDKNIAEHFAGLKGTVTIRNPTGTEIRSEQFDAESIRLWGDDPTLVGFRPFSNGEYTAEIEIQHGASKIEGTQHELYARNDLCGLELLPAYVQGAISAVALLIAIVIACFTAPLVARHGFRTQLPDGKG